MKLWMSFGTTLAFIVKRADEQENRWKFIRNGFTLFASTINKMQKPTLVVLSGADSGKSHVIEETHVSIGRDHSCDIHLNDNEASRRHARLIRTDVNYELEDLHSTTGTWINGIRVKRQRVYNGDQIIIGRSKFEALDFPLHPSNDMDMDQEPMTRTYSPGAHSLIEQLIAAIGNQADMAIENTRLVEQLEREKCALNEANKELKAAHDTLLRSEKLALVGQLASGIVHELKNPIAVIQLSNETLKDQLRSTSGRPVDMDFVKELAGNIGTGIDMCRQVVNRLATYSGNREVKREDVDVGVLIQEIIALLRYETLHAGVEVLFKRVPGHLTIHAKISQIKQVFINMILNALQSMDKNDKSLKITVGQAKYEGRDHIRIRFQDNGKGMTKEQQDRVFKPFFTAPEAEATGRAGLGMSVSHGIVKDHLGFISTSSVPGEGTTMDVYLPGTEPTKNVDPDETQKPPHPTDHAEYLLP